MCHDDFTAANTVDWKRQIIRPVAINYMINKLGYVNDIRSTFRNSMFHLLFNNKTIVARGTVSFTQSYLS